MSEFDEKNGMNEENSSQAGYNTSEESRGASGESNNTEAANRVGSTAEQEQKVDGTYRYSAKEAEKNPEEYRKPPYMRDEIGRGQSSYTSERYRRQDNSYTSYHSGDQGGNGGNGNGGGRGGFGGNGDDPKKKGTGKLIAGIIVAALILGGAAGGAVYHLGSRGNDQAAISAQPTSTEDATQIARSKETTAAAESNQPASSAPETTAAESSTAESSTAATSAAETSTAASGENGSIRIADASEGTSTVQALDVTQVVEKAMPSVVAITTTSVYENYYSGNMSPYEYFFGYGGGYGSYGNQGGTYEVSGAGSGIIIGDDGEELWIVTNNHVVEDADTLKVTLADDTTVEAYVKGTDSDNDLAVVGVKLADLSDDTKKAIAAIEMGDSDTLKLGETTIAIGNALGLGQSVSTGVVSALNREITTTENTTLTTIQTDAAINPGNSGGALLNSQGQLIGINVAKDSETDVEGMGYAIPISKAKETIANLTTMSPKVAVSEDDYPYLGVQLQDIGSNVAKMYNMPEGIMVSYLEENGPAAKGGIMTQDIITKFNGTKVTSYDELTKQLQYYSGGTEVTVTVQRVENGSYVEKEIKVTLDYKKDHQTDNSQSNSDQTDNSQNDQQDKSGSDGSEESQSAQPSDKQQNPNTNNNAWKGFFGR